MKKEETNDILKHLIPAIEDTGISKEFCKIDVTTNKSGLKRGDVWISTEKETTSNFERNIIGLIEAKHQNATIGDVDWRDAMDQGSEKALDQGLNYYIVTNCKSSFRFYNAYTDEEIKIDGKVLTKLVSTDVLQKINSQVTNDNSYVVHESQVSKPVSQNKFRNSLKKLANIYRSAGIKKDNRIDPTISFVVLKYISEKEEEKRTLDRRIDLWDDLRPLAEGEERGDLKVEFKKMMDMIWKTKTYKDNIYSDFENLIVVPDKPKNDHYIKIYKELDKYHFHGANFDLFGAIYENFASKTKKKEFGEFYTRRHITGPIARLLLRNENTPRDLKVCDPACGSGGFLTEAFSSLVTNYSITGKYNNEVEYTLKNDVFWGYDNNDKSIARTKLNMFLVGDGHLHIYENDSLTGWNSDIGFKENEFDYIMANPPMGRYKGGAKKGDFDFTNKSRYELFFLEKIVRATKPGGEIAVIINDGALETPTRENFRKMLLESCNIHSIVSLTEFAFAPYTKEKTYVLFMQKKQESKSGVIQDTPIWHFIVDYDGYANSNKRFQTKYHDDLPELEEKFGEAVDLAQNALRKPNKFKTNKDKFEKEVNKREKEEGLNGMKYAFVDMDDVNENNFHNLLSEYHLRNYEFDEISVEELERDVEKLTKKAKDIFHDF